MRIDHIKKHGLKEVFRNSLSSLRSTYQSIFTPNRSGKVNPPSEYQMVFEDEFKTDLNMDLWRYGQPWGDFHPEHLYQYYDLGGKLAYTTPEGLVLELKNTPKTYIKSEFPPERYYDIKNLPDQFTIPTGIGLVTTKIGWQYGWFETWVKLPEGQAYWPAIWLSGVNSWPPEIDILEAYSETGPKYDGFLLFKKFLKIRDKRIQPNLHYGKVEQGNKDFYGNYDVPVPRCTERFVQYVCHWEKDFIRIYYDGNLILETKNPEVLKWFNGPNDQMMMILQHGSNRYQPKGSPDESKMIVKSFRVWQR